MPLPSKAELRTAMLQRRAQLHPATRGRADAAIGENILSATSMHKEDIISGYTAFRNEPDILPALTTLQRWGTRICLPVIKAANRPLAFHAWKAGEPLQPGQHGILEPCATAPEVYPDLLLMPLLAFDPQGTRLGYGGGYYDRTLEELHAHNAFLITIGIAYDLQHVPALPREKHDIPLDMVITEKAIYDFRSLR